MDPPSDNVISNDEKYLHACAYRLLTRSSTSPSHRNARIPYGTLNHSLHSLCSDSPQHNASFIRMAFLQLTNIHCQPESSHGSGRFAVCNNNIPPYFYYFLTITRTLRTPSSRCFHPCHQPIQPISPRRRTRGKHRSTISSIGELGTP